MKNYDLLPRQRRDWNINYQLNTDAPPAVVELNLHVPCRFKAEDVKQIFKTLLERHEILRTNFPIVNCRVKQQVNDYDEETYEILYLKENDNEFLAQLRGDILLQLKKLDNPSLLKAVVWSNDDEYVFGLLVHHIICDAWSLKIIKEDLEKICREYYLSQPITEIKENHSINKYFKSKKVSVRKIDVTNNKYWQNKLNTKDWLVDFDDMFLNILGEDKGREKIKKFRGWRSLDQQSLYENPKGHFYSAYMDKKLYSKLHEFAAKNHLSTYSIIMGSFMLLGAEMTKNNNVLMRGIYSNRHDLTSQRVVGNLLGDLVLPLEVNSDDTFKEHIKKCYYLFFESANKMLLNIDSLEKLKVLTRSFMMFNFLNSDTNDSVEYLGSKPPEFEDSYQIWSPLFCDAVEHEHTIHFKCGFHSQYYDYELIEAMFNWLFNMMEKALSDPDQSVRLLTGEKIPTGVKDVLTSNNWKN